MSVNIPCSEPKPPCSPNRRNNTQQASRSYRWLLDADDQKVVLQELADRWTCVSDPTFATCKARALNSVKPESSDNISYVE